MRYFYLLLVALIASTQTSASDVGISIRIGQPGFYGELHFGGYHPMPQLIYPQPILAWQTPANLLQPPIYLHVPPGHAKNWNKHCYRYRACHRNVYFVQESWYHNVYIPYHQKRSSYQHRRDDRYRQADQHHPRSISDKNRRDRDRGDYDHRYRGKHDKGHGSKKHDKIHRKD